MSLLQEISSKFLKISNSNSAEPVLDIASNIYTNFTTLDPNFMPTYQGLIQLFPFYLKSYEKEPDYDNHYIEDIKEKIEENIKKYEDKFEDTFKRGKENIIEKRKLKEEYSREDSQRAEDDAKKAGGFLTKIISNICAWVVNTITSSIKNMLITGWNKTITGFIILVFIILFIFVIIPNMKKNKDIAKNNELKRQDGSMMSMLLSMPQDFNIAFNDFSLFVGDVTDSVSNTMEFASNTVKSIRAPTPDLRERGRETDGRGGDNLFHIEGKYLVTPTPANYLGDKIYNIYKPSAQEFADNVKISPKDTINLYSIDKYELNCESNNPSYIDSNCLLKPLPYTNNLNEINKDNTDYINIELK